MALSKWPFWTSLVASAVTLVLSTAIGAGAGLSRWLSRRPGERAGALARGGSRWGKGSGTRLGGQGDHPRSCREFRALTSSPAPSREPGSDASGLDRRGRLPLGQDLLHEPGVVLPRREAPVGEDPAQERDVG